jgi:hypothetical protein
MDDANTDPPPCAALLEANLKPAHVLRIMGLLRFRRIVLSRDKSSTLHQVWAVIEFHAATTDEHSLNDEVHRLQQKYSNQIGDTRSRIQNTNRSEKNWWITSRNKKCGPGNSSTYAPLAPYTWRRNRAVDQESEGMEGHYRIRTLDGKAGRAAACAAIQHEAPGVTPGPLQTRAPQHRMYANAMCVVLRCTCTTSKHCDVLPARHVCEAPLPVRPLQAQQRHGQHGARDAALCAAHATDRGPTRNDNR